MLHKAAGDRCKNGDIQSPTVMAVTIFYQEQLQCTLQRTQAESFVWNSFMHFLAREIKIDQVYIYIYEPCKQSKLTQSLEHYILNFIDSS